MAAVIPKFENHQAAVAAANALRQTLNQQQFDAPIRNTCMTKPQWFLLFMTFATTVAVVGLYLGNNPTITSLADRTVTVGKTQIAFSHLFIASATTLFVTQCFFAFGRATRSSTISDLQTKNSARHEVIQRARTDFTARTAFCAAQEDRVTDALHQAQEAQNTISQVRQQLTAAQNQLSTLANDKEALVLLRHVATNAFKASEGQVTNLKTQLARAQQESQRLEELSTQEGSVQDDEIAAAKERCTALQADLDFAQDNAITQQGRICTLTEQNKLLESEVDRLTQELQTSKEASQLAIQKLEEHSLKANLDTVLQLVEKDDQALELCKQLENSNALNNRPPSRGDLDLRSFSPTISSSSASADANKPGKASSSDDDNDRESILPLASPQFSSRSLSPFMRPSSSSTVPPSPVLGASAEPTASKGAQLIERDALQQQAFQTWKQIALENEQLDSGESTGEYPVVLRAAPEPAEVLVEPSDIFPGASTRVARGWNKAFPDVKNEAFPDVKNLIRAICNDQSDKGPLDESERRALDQALATSDPLNESA